MSTGSDRAERSSVLALDAILGHSFGVLNDGFVRLIDYMGSDTAVVQAARVSYGSGTKSVSDDRTLIRYLMRHMHTTPFEMCELKLHVRVPMDTWRQWIRHRTASVNEYSTRYSLAIDSMATTSPGEWRVQDPSNKQGSGRSLSVAMGTQLTAAEAELHEVLRKSYAFRLAQGVAREQARKDLPLSTYTEAYWKIDLHNLLHFLSLRMSAAAQYEIRQYAAAIGNEIVSRWVPTVWEAFLDYRVDAMRLSRSEIAVTSALFRGATEEALNIARGAGFVRRGADGLEVDTREGREAATKLRQLGLAVPWSVT